MWRSTHEAFQNMVKFGRSSPNFSKALCEAGIVEVLQNILSNAQIQEAYYMHNVVSCLLSSAVVHWQKCFCLNFKNLPRPLFLISHFLLLNVDVVVCCGFLYL